MVLHAVREYRVHKSSQGVGGARLIERQLCVGTTQRVIWRRPSEAVLAASNGSTQPRELVSMLSVALGLAWYVHRAYTWSSSGCAVLLLPLCKNPVSFISLDTFVCLSEAVLVASNGSTQPRELVSMLSVALGLAWYVHRAYTWSSSGCAVLLLPLCKNPLSSISLGTRIVLYEYQK